VRFEGTTEFMAEPAAIWSVLVEPSRIGPCAPVPIERVDDRRYRATTKIGGGLFSARVTLELEVVEAVENELARLQGRGSGSGTTLSGSTSFRLRNGSMAGMTAVDWVAELELEGMFAGPASRVIAEQGEGAIAKLLDCVRRQVEEG
jgi:carbon monoxide dehydrogenase subunit G